MASRPSHIGLYTPIEAPNEAAFKREQYARLREDIERKRRQIGIQPPFKGGSTTHSGARGGALPSRECKTAQHPHVRTAGR
ncbi:hypothetical protein CEXT_438341 [Caerostris extrusa]|uniref:Uncharacterized protein n=1 Tax=Caerostris extrusa TaxID=172846 RepID=A0AAV4VIW2_CAEEX|nr:hypothetical protein CEXT_438341 [Caerostris extrusa]